MGTTVENKNFNFVLVHYSQETLAVAEEINAYALEDFFCDGIEEFSLEEARVDQILGERAYSGGDVPESLIDEVQAATKSAEEIIYKYYFYSNDHAENAQDFEFFLKSNFKDLPVLSFQKEVEDWNAEWRKFYAPIIVSERLEIIPEWLKDTRQESKAEKVFIYPGMGFGTGTHETTFLCLRLFDQIQDEYSATSTCLDFGCGSGILAIAAMKTRQLKTVFCDIDKSALDNCVQNLVLNFEGQSLEGTKLVIRDRLAPDSYDLIFANILEHVLVLEKNLLINSLKPGAHLIVSGLLNHQVEGIVENYKELSQVSVISKNDWSAILFKKI
jgi:ribosomal protein L11 methyltransferase